MPDRSLFRSLRTIVNHLLLLIARKILSFLLPIPFFSNVSVVLATLVGINPLTLKPPSIKLPPILTQFLTSKLIPDFLRPSKPPLQALQSETIELGEKIRTWRQRDILTAAERKFADDIASLSGLPMDRAKKTGERPNIQKIEFGGTAENEMTKVLADSIEALHHVSPSFKSPLSSKKCQPI